MMIIMVMMIMVMMMIDDDDKDGSGYYDEYDDHYGYDHVTTQDNKMTRQIIV